MTFINGGGFTIKCNKCGKEFQFPFDEAIKKVPMTARQNEDYAIASLKCPFGCGNLVEVDS